MHSILSLMNSTMAHFKNMLFLILTAEYRYRIIAEDERVTRNHVKINRRHWKINGVSVKMSSDILCAVTYHAQ
jgi:hypothetical protein